MGIFEYFAYGLKIITNRALPYHPMKSGETESVIPVIIKKSEAVECRLHPYRTPAVEMHGRTVSLGSNLPLYNNRKIVERKWELTVEGLFSYRWSNREDHVEVVSDSHPDMGKLSFWLFHTVIPVYLMLKKTSFFLHASAIEVDGYALLFLAPTFGGKSTLVDSFVRRGYRLISDDKLRLNYLNHQYFAYPSHPYRRYVRDNESLGTFTSHLASAPRPIKALYLLNLVEPNGVCLVDELQGLDKFEGIKRAYLYEPALIDQKRVEKYF